MAKRADRPTRTRTRSVLAVLCALSLVGAGACGIEKKRDDARAIRRAPEHLATVGTAVGELTIEVIVRKSTTQQLSGVAAPATKEVAGVRLEFGRRRASVELPVADQPEPAAVALFSEDVLYQRRLGQAGVGTTSGRQWLKLRFQDLYDGRDNVAATGFGLARPLNPAYLVDLLDGALTGSVERAGSETLHGALTTRFRVNLAIDKAFDNAPTRRHEGIQAVLAVMGASYTRALRSEVWLDGRGMPRRIRTTVRQDRDRQHQDEVTYTLDLFEFGQPFEVHLPKKREIAAITGIGPILQVLNPIGVTGQ